KKLARQRTDLSAHAVAEADPLHYHTSRAPLPYSGERRSWIAYFENQFEKADFDPAQWLDIALYY
ncbi:MAG: hypothetical protein CPDRYMAC_5742, partial [uncultured Paraburkholderia sp.]